MWSDEPGTPCLLQCEENCKNILDIIDLDVLSVPIEHFTGELPHALPRIATWRLVSRLTSRPWSDASAYSKSTVLLSHPLPAPLSV